MSATYVKRPGLFEQSLMRVVDELPRTATGKIQEFRVTSLVDDAPQEA